MVKSNNAVVATRKGALDPVNRKKFLKGENFEFNGTPGDFWQGSYLYAVRYSAKLCMNCLKGGK